MSKCGSAFWETLLHLGEARSLTPFSQRQNEETGCGRGLAKAIGMTKDVHSGVLVRASDVKMVCDGTFGIFFGGEVHPLFGTLKWTIKTKMC